MSRDHQDGSGGAVEFDLAAARRNIQAVRPGMRILEVSAKTGLGMDQWLGFLRERREESRHSVAMWGSFKWSGCQLIFIRDA